jgi:hypothetical protein
VEVGVRFRSSVAGYVTGLRFYKGAGNTGTHVAHLWRADGTLLATATFTAETATGWQQVNFAPVAIAANTTYVASYYAPNGGYAHTGGYFAAAGAASGPLEALSSPAAGGNGVYRYGSGGGFPQNSFNAANYWVDVVFSTVQVDTTPPTITSRTPTAGAVGVAIDANVAVTFSEPVQAGTIGLEVRDSANNLVAGQVTYDGATRTATFQPSQNWLALRTYTVTVSGVRDPGDNLLATSTWSYTIQGTWRQTSSSDFGTGAKAGVAVTPAGDGAVQLAPSIRDDFGAASLGSQWTVRSWGAATPATVGGGAVSVAGGMIETTGTYPGQIVEGLVRFGAASFQHFGLATGLASVGGEAWAIFSTAGTSDQLYARVNAFGTTQDVLIGALSTQYRLYRITPTATGYDFAIDGVTVATVGLTVPAGTQMRAVLSALSTSVPLQADWIAVTSYPTTGTFTSVAYDAGQTVAVQAVTWSANVPAGTTLRVEVSVSGDNTSWSSWAEVANGAALDGVSGRYVRYRVIFTTADPAVTPVLEGIELRLA